MLSPDAEYARPGPDRSCRDKSTSVDSPRRWPGTWTRSHSGPWRSGRGISPLHRVEPGLRLGIGNRHLVIDLGNTQHVASQGHSSISRPGADEIPVPENTKKVAQASSGYPKSSNRSQSPPSFRAGSVSERDFPRPAFLQSRVPGGWRESSLAHASSSVGPFSPQRRLLKQPDLACRLGSGGRFKKTSGQELSISP